MRSGRVPETLGVDIFALILVSSQFPILCAGEVDGGIG